MGYGNTMAARPLECLGKTRPTRRVPSFILIAVTTITFLSYDKCTSIPLRQSKLTLRQKAALVRVVARSKPVGLHEVREPWEAGPVLRATKDSDSDCEFAGGWKVCGKSNCPDSTAFSRQILIISRSWNCDLPVLRVASDVAHSA